MKIMTSSKPNESFRGVRFPPDPKTLAQLDVEGSAEFKPSLYGLVLNESYQGCALILLKDERISAGAPLRVQVGQLAPMRAEVRWHKELDDQVVKIGLFYLE